MSIYARGKRAFGFCDVTGFRYRLRDLVPLVRDGRDTGFRRILGSFDPVGGGITELGSRTVGLDITGEMGKVTVVIS